MRDLTILDGSGYVFRAYHAIPPLHDKDGNNINAIFGFFRMLLKLWIHKPTYFVIARDSPTITLRKVQFEEYKANRAALPDDFKPQMRAIKDLVTQLEIPFLQEAGYEADDIIATLVEGFVGDGKAEHVTIVTSDKDLKQLLRDQVVIFDPVKNITITQKTFQEEYGFSPPAMVDYLSLVGDSSDNIPGVKGIGPKNAAELIQKRGSVEALYDHLDEISSAAQQKLRDGQESAFHSKSLVKLMDVESVRQVDMGCRKCGFNFERMKDVLVGQYGFQSLEKIIDDLKKQRQAGEQLSLFG